MKLSNELEIVVVVVVVGEVVVIVVVVVVGHGLKLPKPQYLQFWIPPATQPIPPSICGVEEHSGS